VYAGVLPRNTMLQQDDIVFLSAAEGDDWLVQAKVTACRFSLFDQ
jgi:hypothetical protein